MKSNKFFLLLLLVTIIAGCGGGGGSTPATLVSIAISPANPSIAVGTAQQFTAIGTFSNNAARDITASVTWSSSNTGVATVSNAAGSMGRALSSATGSSVITATSGGVSASTTLTVTSATLVSIAILPSNLVVSSGSTGQLMATGSFSNNTTQDITTIVTWSSSNTGVATISNTLGSNGLVTGVSVGTATATATMAGPAGNISASTSLTVIGAAVAQANVIPITVNGAQCSSGSYINEPCVSITMCAPGTSTCQTINDILVDTGSYGIRIFKQATSLSLPQVAVPSGSLAECVQFADGSSIWGPIRMASVILGGEPAVQIPIQIADATFGTRPTACQNAYTSPAGPRYNGILGIGLLVQDCGAVCAGNAANGLYYSCNGAACTPSTAPLASQVQNPVASLPVDNNGVIVQLPSIPAAGQPSVNGSLILGIGTQANNTPAGVVAYAANQFGEFTTTFNGSVLTNSFIDSGSNALFFSDPAIATCPGTPSASGLQFYCPPTTLSFTAVNTASTGAPSGVVAFKIGNVTDLVASGNRVFSDIGGTGLGGFDWGLPFFFGRNVVIGIEGRLSYLGTGPYWAY